MKKCSRIIVKKVLLTVKSLVRSSFIWNKEKTKAINKSLKDDETKKILAKAARFITESIKPV